MPKALFWFIALGVSLAIASCGGGGGAGGGGTSTTGGATGGTTSGSTGSSLFRYLYVSNRGFAGGGFVRAYEVFSGGLLTDIDTENVGITPSGVAVSATGEYLYVSHLTANVVSQFQILPGGTLAPLSPATVALTANPWSIIAHPSKNAVYVPDSTGNKVYQFTVSASGQLVPKTPAFVACGSDPRNGFVHPSGDTLYITCSAAGEVRQYSIAVDGSLSPHSTPVVAAVAGANGIDMTRTGASYAYVACETAMEIRAYTVSVNHSLVPLATSGTSVRSLAAAVSNDNSYFFTSDFDGTTISQYDILPNGTLSALSPASVQASDGPMPIFVLRGTNALYVANQGSNTVTRYLVAANGQLESPQTYVTGDPGSSPNGFATVQQ